MIFLAVMNRGQGTGGVWGGRTPPGIRDLYSKNFENSQKKNFLSIRPPLGKYRSLAPDHVHSPVKRNLKSIIVYLFMCISDKIKINRYNVIQYSIGQWVNSKQKSTILILKSAEFLARNCSLDHSARPGRNGNVSS